MFLLVFAGVFILDQLSKHMVRSSMFPGESIPTEGFFRLEYVQNTGAAFGILDDARLLLITVGLISLGVITWVTQSHRITFLNSTWGRLSTGLVAGGILGNLIDRIFFGYVTDFAKAGFWPNFNIADSALVIGMALLAILFFREESSRGH